GLKYFRFQDEEYWILKQFDGTKSLDEIKDGFEAEFPPQKITLEDLQSFIGTLHQSGLIIAGVPDQGHELLKRRDKRRKKEIVGAMSNILCVKFKGLDLDTLLGKMVPYVSFLYKPAVVISCLLLCLSALLLVLVEFDYFRSKLPGFYTFFSPANIFFLSVTLACTKVLHEFGHGLTCKYFGGECHEMGVMILVLTPCLYCNVSDSWMLPSKWHRMAIGLAGVYIECVLAAVCTYIWWFSTPGLLNYLCLNVMFVSSVSTVVFNINPLLRYDGYYILADYLEIPNLRQKANTILTRKCSEWFLGMEQQPDPFLPKKNQVMFALFTVASFAYRWVVMASILFFVYRFCDSYGFKVVGQMIAMMSIWGLVGMPVVKVVKFFWVPGRIYRVKKARFYMSLTGFFIIVAAIALIKLPYSVVVPFIVELQAESSQAVYIPEFGGRLVQICVKPEDHVEKGDLLAVIKNIQLVAEVAELNRQVEELEAKISYLEISRTSRSDVASSLETLHQQLNGKKEELAKKAESFKRLEIIAPISGTVFPPPSRPNREAIAGQLPQWSGTPLEPENHGLTIEPAATGPLFCSIGDIKKLDAVLVVDDSKAGFIKVGQSVELKFDEYPSETYDSTIIADKDIEGSKMTSIPIPLSTKGKGEIPTKTEEGIEVPSKPSYRILVSLNNDNKKFLIGMTGSAKVHVEPQSLLQRGIRLFWDTFTFKL
ncbi:MAG: biotin/lipoyl-binding protein, partial [Thermoguttaceae bacterium]